MPVRPGTYFVDNAPIREAVMFHVRRGECTVTGLAGEMGYNKPNADRIRRALGLRPYRCAHTLKMVRSKGLSIELGNYLWERAQIPSERREDILVPIQEIESGYGNGRPMYYSWRLRLLVQKALDEGRFNLYQLADDLGHRRPDANHLRRMLGLKVEKGKVQRVIAEDKALWLCYRLGYDPVDWGI